MGVRCWGGCAAAGVLLHGALGFPRIRPSHPCLRGGGKGLRRLFLCVPRAAAAGCLLPLRCLLSVNFPRPSRPLLILASAPSPPWVSPLPVRPPETPYPRIRRTSTRGCPPCPRPARCRTSCATAALRTRRVLCCDFVALCVVFVHLCCAVVGGLLLFGCGVVVFFFVCGSERSAAAFRRCAAEHFDGVCPAPTLTAYPPTHPTRPVSVFVYPPQVLRVPADRRAVAKALALRFDQAEGCQARSVSLRGLLSWKYHNLLPFPVHRRPCGRQTPLRSRFSCLVLWQCRGDFASEAAK